MSDLWTMIDVYCVDGPLAGKRTIVDGSRPVFQVLEALPQNGMHSVETKKVEYQRYTFGDERRNGSEPLIIFPKWSCVEWSLSDAADWGRLFAHRLIAPAIIRAEWCIGAVDHRALTQAVVRRVMRDVPPRSREITVDEPPRGWQWPIEYRRGYVSFAKFSLNRPVPLGVATKAGR